MKAIRYEDFRVDRVLLKEFQIQLENDFKRIQGHNDVELLLKEFEKTFASYIGTKHALALNSGSDALQLSLLASGIGKGDEVILPSLTYPAVPLSILYAQAVPVFVDISLKDLQMDLKAAAAAVTKRTRGILCPHMFGRSCCLESVLALAKKSKALLIEDCCQAESSEYKGQKLGSFGDISCFSFSYYKPLSSCGGGGGMVCFNNPLFLRISDYTKVWQDDEALLEIPKRFARMYLLDLVAIKTKMKYLSKIIQSRERIKTLYEQELRGIENCQIMTDTENVRSVAQNLVILTPRRDALGDFLHKRNIFWQKPYHPVHDEKIFKKFAKGSYPNSRIYWEQALHLPLYSFMSQDECLGVVRAVKDFFKK